LNIQEQDISIDVEKNSKLIDEIFEIINFLCRRDTEGKLVNDESFLKKMINSKETLVKNITTKQTKELVEDYTKNISNVETISAISDIAPVFIHA